MSHSHEGRNPWHDIPADDYERHMAMETVRQLQALNRIFEDLLKKYEPRTLAVVGCATGNGFEHIQPALTRTIVGVDLNARYLEIVRDRYGESLPDLKLVCGDVLEISLEEGAYDLVHAGLIFEYVDPTLLLGRAASWLRPGGTLSAVLQLPSETSGAVTETPYESLKRLEPFMRLVDTRRLSTDARRVGLNKIGSRDIGLPGGKRLRVMLFERETHD